MHLQETKTIRTIMDGQNHANATEIKQSYAWAGARKQVEFPELNVDPFLSEPIDHTTEIEQSYAWAGDRKQVEFPELNLDPFLSEPIDYEDGYDIFIEKRTLAAPQNLIETIQS